MMRKRGACTGRQRVSQRLVKLRCGAMLLSVTVLLLAGCGGSGTGGPLDFIRPDRYAVNNPSKTAARVTGTACSGTEGGAQVEAKDTALYNLRSVTGNADYQVRYRVLRIYPDGDRICAEVEAAAVK